MNKRHTFNALRLIVRQGFKVLIQITLPFLLKEVWSWLGPVLSVGVCPDPTVHWIASFLSVLRPQRPFWKLQCPLIKKEWPKLKISEEIVTSYLVASVRLVGGNCHLWEMNTICIGHLHVFHNAPHLPPKNVAQALFSISLGTAVIPRRNEKQRLAKFWEANKVH